MPRLEERAELEFDRAEQPVGVHRMIRPSLGFSLPEVGLGNLQRSTKLSTQERNRKPPVRQAPILGITGRGGGELMGALDRRSRLLAAPPLCPLHRASVVDMHLGASLPLFESLADLLVLRQRREQRLSLDDLWHFGVGVKPSSAGARTAWASAGRAVD